MTEQHLNRAKELAFLELALVTSFEENADWWRDFMQMRMRLKRVYVPLVICVLKEGRWRNADRPFAYVRSAAWKMGSPENIGIRAAPPSERPLSDLRIPNDCTHQEFIEWRCSEAVLEERPDPTTDWLNRPESKSGLSIDWNRLFAELKVSTDLARYILAKRNGTVYGTHFAETTRKQFERLKPKLALAIRRQWYGELEDELENMA